MKAKKRVTRSWVLVIIGLIIIVGLAMAAYWMMAGGNQPKPEAVFAEVEIGSIENSIVATGTLEPKHYVEVGAQVSGQVEHIHVEEGQNVKAGELLVEIDATVFETQLKKAEAALESKKAQLNQLRAELELAELRAKRNEQLYKQQAVSEDTLFSSKTNVKVLKSRIETSIAQIKADQAGVEGDRARLGYAKIYAPISGTIASIQVREGQTLNSNQNAPLLLKISDLSTMTLRAEVSEADVTKLFKGMSVYFSTLGDLKNYWHTQVRQVLPTPRVVNDVVLYQALMDIENNNRRLMDSMTTQVFFVVEKAEDVMVVPLSAIRNTPRGSMALVKTETGIERVNVQTGVKNRTQVEILSGLNVGQQVIVGQKRNPGQSAERGQRKGFQGNRGGGRRGGF
ncbi:efflux RND transporter periplasmic adaptor subunit [Catenovulum adriaticum]|uniref:Efflux RND transporter periplasmic adaptor subunit n=1 Tax=Catenovulum adriaticum TaxID=2984846 RepID=A0ABY7AM40_9ALTE|nr:efflux RND transporter periplasmic adaptor subunit [Catenovulum sp. TS8]WAJ70283.1 efflux RND transporter periplasmic adaptor subunit [Catenovulum sp. TS8]